MQPLREGDIITIHQPTEKIKLINCLRGLAILMVIVFHCTANFEALEPFHRIIIYGQMGVQLFFVISAYTLCLSYERRRDEKHSVINFYLRRFFRIAPMYYLGILIYFSVRVFIFHQSKGNIVGDYTWQHVLANIFFIHGFYAAANNNIVPGGWSIGTEMAFYVIFPLLYYVYEKIRLVHRWHIIIAILSAGIIQLLTFELGRLTPQSLGNNSFYYYSIFNQLPVFLTGISGYWMMKELGDKLLKFKKMIPVLFVVLCLFSVARFEHHFLTTISPFISAVSFFLLIPILKFYPQLQLSFLAKIGENSYSMYILHFLFAYLLSGNIAMNLSPYWGVQFIFPIVCIISVVGSYYLARFTGRWLEKPGIRLGNRLIASIK